MFLRRVLTKQSKAAYFSTLNVKTSNKYHTPFHSVMNEGTSVAEALKFMNDYPINMLADMAKTSNDQGELPIDLFFDNSSLLNDPCVSLLYDNVINVTKHHTIKDVTESINIDDIINSNYAACGLTAGLYDNLVTGVSVVNDVRAVINTSASHPCINALSKNEKKEIHNELKKIRSFYDNNDDPKLILTGCQMFKMGNCHELSFAAISFLKEKTKHDISAHVMQIYNGDHTFVMFGSKCEDKLENIVYIDVWSGEVGISTVENMTNALGTFRRFYDTDESIINVIAKLNPNYHSFYIRKSFDIEKTQNSVAMLGLFQKNSHIVEPAGTPTHMVPRRQ